MMNILMFLAGVMFGVFLRNIVRKIIEIDRKIKWAEKITEEEKKRMEFKEKYDFSDSFDDSESGE